MAGLTLPAGRFSWKGWCVQVDLRVPGPQVPPRHFRSMAVNETIRNLFQRPRLGPSALREAPGYFPHLPKVTSQEGKKTQEVLP